MLIGLSTGLVAYGSDSDAESPKHQVCMLARLLPFPRLGSSVLVILPLFRQLSLLTCRH